ncbi:MAG: hypothetical protein KKA07_00445, partial [Bacteroidetes bacterium]|nr:hypothetical protein [Bacteroidota bacterium]
HPLQYELDQKKFVLQPLWDQIKNDTSFTTINLFDEFRKRNSGGNDVIFWQKDGHNNSKGYKLWADIIAEILFPNNKQITQ